MPMRFFRGFSFVEVMMVIAIIGIMLGITFVSLAGKRDAESVKWAARDMAAAVRTAQSSALSGVRRGIPPPANPSDPPKSLCWTQLQKRSSAEYELFVRYRDAADLDCVNDGEDGASEIYTLPNGVSFLNGNWNTLGTSLSFEVPRGTFRESVSTLVLIKGSQRISVCVLSSGVVIEKPVSTVPSSCP